MHYHGSCHCGRIALDVEGELGKVEWFVPRSQLRLASPETNLATYTFDKHVIKASLLSHLRLCPVRARRRSVRPTAAINARCLEGVELETLTRIPFDGRSR